MATRKRPAKKTSKPEVKKDVEFSPDRRITVSIGTALDYGKVKINLALSENIKNDTDVDEMIDSIYEGLEAKLEEKFSALCESTGIEKEFEDAEDDEPEDDEPEDDEPEDDEEDDEEDDLTEEKILHMKKAELLELIKEEELEDINTKLPIKKLREAIVDAIFESEEESEEEWDDEEWDDE